MSRRTTDPFPVIPGFTIEAEIGRGTSARVFRARQEKLNRTVALKVIPTLGADGNRRALRLFREASLTGALDHPAIVRAIDAGDRDELCWFAMELVEGRTLQQMLDESGPWPWKRAVALGLEILDALDHAHRRGVVHRDLKPSNILVDSEGHARLLDLGLARRESDPRLTHEGGTVGTPRYMAPEQALDPRKVDGRADLFALGAVLYRMISGVAPFEGETVAAVLTRLLYDEPAPLSMLQPDLPAAVSLVIGKVLEKDPSHRFIDAREFAEALREASRGRRPKALSSGSRGVRLLAAGAVAVLLGAGLFLYFKPKPGAPAPHPPSVQGPPTPAAHVREFVPPAHPELAPLDRARLALAANDREAGDFNELEAALLPLQQDLKAAAAQHRAAARGVLLTGGVGPARQRMGQLADRLRSDVARDGEETLHPGLERLVETTARETNQSFEADLRKEQEDAAGDLEIKLDALASRQDARAWSLSEQQTKVQEVLKEGGILSLEGEQRLRVEKKRDEVLKRLAAIPVNAASDAMAHARREIAEGRYLTARKLLAEMGGVPSQAGAPGAIVEAKPLYDAIEAGETKLVADAEALVDRIARGPAKSLDAAARGQKVADVEARLSALSRSVEEVPQMAEAVAFAQKVSKVGVDAAALRARVLEKLGAGAPPNTTADWKVKGKGSLGVRVVTGREGGRIVVRKQDGAPETWDAEDVEAQTIADVGRALGEAPAPLAVALLEFWDGEDDAAQTRLKALPGDPVRDWMLGLVGAAIETAASTYPTDAEREAFPVFLQAKRRFAEGSYARALELVGPLLAQKRLTGTAFLRQHQEEMNRIATQSKSMLARSSRLRPFGASAEVKDDKAGVVRIVWTFGPGRPTEGLTMPAGSELVEEGLKWPGRTGTRASLPEQAPGLHVDFGEGVPASPATVELEVMRSPDLVPYVAVSYAGYSLLALGDLTQSSFFAGVPLHGLERELIQVQSVQKAVLVAGSFQDARKALPAAGRAATLNRGETTIVRLRIDSERGELTGMVGGEKITVTGERRAFTEPPALDLRLPPGVVLKALTVELALVPKKTE